jgi:predicted HTH transcriptional regulator
LTEYNKENEFIEFKVDNFEPKKIGEALSALANGAGFTGEEYGYLVYGVEDASRKIVGTSFKPKVEKVGSEDFELWLNKMLSPTTNIEIFEFKDQEKDIVVFRVPACIDRPLDFQSQSFIRIGSNTRNLKDFPDRERSIWNNIKNRNFERQMASTNLTVDEVLSVLDYAKYFQLLSLPLPSTPEKIIDSFTQEGFVVKRIDRFDVTNLGAILFATDIRRFSGLKRKAVRVIMYRGKNKVEAVREKEGVFGYAVGFEGLISFINDLLPSNEEIKKVVRVEKKMYPEIAIRELVANALIHQDFCESGTSPTIEIFDDRIEISNPGKPLIDTERFIDHKPKSRNELTASFMRRVGFCEERGSGVSKIVSAAEVFQLPAPRFKEYDTYIVATLFSHQSLGAMSKEDKIRACFQHCVLKYISNEQMTNASLRARFGLSSTTSSTTTTTKIISETVEAGKIKPFDPSSHSKKLAKYVPFFA